MRRTAVHAALGLLFAATAGCAGRHSDSTLRGAGRDPCAIRIAPEVPYDPALLALVDELDFECVPDARGAFRVVFDALVVTERTTTDDADDESAEAAPDRTVDGTYEIVYVGRDGTIAHSDPIPFAEAIDETLFVRNVLTPIARYDFDGDGISEIAIRTQVIRFEEPDDGFVTVYGVVGDRVERYRAAEDVYDDVRDVDGDHRPDLVSLAPYAIASPWAIEFVPAGGPLHVFHARVDGTFSDSDDVALELVRRACSTRPTTILPPMPSDEGYDQAGLRVSCARIWGEDGEALANRILRELESGVCHDLEPSTCDALAETLVDHARSLVPLHSLR